MVIFGRRVSLFVLINGILGIMQQVGGVITAYINQATNNNASALHITGLVLVGFGTLQTLFAVFVHEFQPGGPAEPPQR